VIQQTVSKQQMVLNKADNTICYQNNKSILTNKALIIRYKVFSENVMQLT